MALSCSEGASPSATTPISASIRSREHRLGRAEEAGRRVRRPLRRTTQPTRAIKGLALSPGLCLFPLYFKYSESFNNSGGIFGNGGNSCEYPLNSAVVFSARLFPSWIAILWGFFSEYPSHNETPAYAPSFRRM